MPPIILVSNLSKDFQVHDRAPGFWAGLKSFFHRRYRLHRAVDQISFEIAPGEIVGFLGPNGAGKTTTLKMLSGLLHPSTGMINVNGFTPYERRDAFLKTISLVMGQRQQLSWDLPAADSFLVLRAIYDIPKPVYQARLARLTDMLELDGILTRQVRKLSLGERMKCEVAAALLHEPKILFLDEPTIGLDINAQQALRRFVADYNRETGATVLLTSHYMADVTALCRRILVINQGKIEFDGDLAALIERQAPVKRLKLQFTAPVASTALAQHGTVIAQDQTSAIVEVPRANAVAVASALLNHQPVADIAIEDLPVEDVIASLFGKRVPAERAAS